MKKISLTALSFLSFFSFGQKSIYFSTPLPSEENKVATVDEKYFGSYTSEKDLRTYTFDEEGITIISTTVTSISKEMVRETSAYDVRDNYIFGIVEGDSLPCVLEKGRYYFGLRNEDRLIDSGNENVLTRISSAEYVVNIKEDGRFVPMKVSFEQGQCSISYFDYTDDSRLFDYIENKQSLQTEYLEMVILEPSKSEGDSLLKKNIFSAAQILIKT